MKSGREICNEVQQEGSSRQSQSRYPRHKMPKTLWFETDLCVTLLITFSVKLHQFNISLNFPKVLTTKHLALQLFLKNPNQQYKTVGTQSSSTTQLCLTTAIEQALTLAHHVYSNKAHSHEVHFTAYPEVRRIKKEKKR